MFLTKLILLVAIFYSFSLWIFHNFLYKWNFWNLRGQTVSHKWGQKHRLPDTYVNKGYANVLEFMKITSNSTLNRQKRQKAQNDKKLVFQKN